ncbi:MAG: hypothetical protein WBC70_16510 [Candidatus Aminicenantales bacterium]
MKKIWSGVPAFFIILASLAFPAGQETEQERPEPEPRHRFLNLSLFYPVSTNQSKHDTANLSLSLFYGHLGSVSGLDFSLGAAALERSLEGVQLAGLIAVAGESMVGGQAAGLISVAGERSQGIQLAGLGCVSGKDLTGIQASGLFSVAGERMTGIQASGLFSVSGEAAKGIQVSGLFGIAGETLEGFQASGLFSLAGENLSGVQVSGLINIAGEDSRAFQYAGLMNIGGGTCRGVQIGLFNVAGRLTGVQVGVVNVAGELEGLPVGLVNVTRREDRRIRMAAWAGNTALFNAGVKISAKRFYSILYAGTVNLTQDERSGLAYGFQYGYGLPVKWSRGANRELRVNIDAGYLYLDNSTVFRHLEGTPDRHALSARGGLEVALSDCVSLVAGLGLRYAIDYGAEFGSGRFAPLVFAGVELF